MGTRIRNLGRSINNTKHKVRNEINVTPFIDVVLVLLIVFMITSPMMMTGFEVNLPKTESGSLNVRLKQVTITLEKSGKVRLENKLVSHSQLLSNLKERVRKDRSLKVFLKADQGVDYGKVMKLFSAVKNSGVDNVALVTEIE